MNTRSIVSGCLLCAVICTQLLCTSSDQPVMAGNSSQTPNSLVGTLFEPDGIKPAQGIKVKIRPKNTLALGTNGTFSVIRDTASTVTNDYGCFSFDTSLAAGIYVIEAFGGSNAVFIDSIQIIKDVTDTLPPDTLKPAGGIAGKIRLGGGGDPSNVYVLAFGVDRFTEVKNDGSFELYPLGKGMYDLRIITILPDYGSLDTFDVEVISAETTDIGTLELPYSGFPMPSGLKSSYDSVTQMVTVSWNRMDTSLVKKYLLTRKFKWGEAAYSDSITCYDTIYSEKIDLTKKAQWECQVAGVDSNGFDGPQTDPIRYTWGSDTLIEIGQYILIEQVSDSMKLTKDADDNMWLADYGSKKVLQYSRNGTLRTSWAAEIAIADKFKGSAFNNYILKVDINKNIYLENAVQQMIMKYDSTGNLVGSLIDTGLILITSQCTDQNGYLYRLVQSRKQGSNRWMYKYKQSLDIVDSFMVRWAGEMNRDLVLYDNVFYFNYTHDSNAEYSHVVPHRIFGISGFNRKFYIVAECISFAIDDKGFVYGIDGPDAIWVSDTTLSHQKHYKFNLGQSTGFDHIIGFEIMNDGAIMVAHYNKNSRSCAIHFYRRLDDVR